MHGNKEMIGYKIVQITKILFTFITIFVIGELNIDNILKNNQVKYKQTKIKKTSSKKQFLTSEYKKKSVLL